MGRPRKSGITPEEENHFTAFRDADLLPFRSELLQATICALLNRFRRVDEQTARQLAVFVQALAAKEKFWEQHRSKPQDALDLTSREWKDYCRLLGEIALGDRTNKTHCAETIVDQTALLDRYLEEHSDFAKCRNRHTRFAWIMKHGQPIFDQLSIIPCFCTYTDEIIAAHPPLNWEPAPKPPQKIKEMLYRGASPADLRDAILGLLHGTTHANIAKIRKKESSITSAELFFQPLDQVIEFPDFRP